MFDERTTIDPNPGAFDADDGWDELTRAEREETRRAPTTVKRKLAGKGAALAAGDTDDTGRPTPPLRNPNPRPLTLDEPTAEERGRPKRGLALVADPSTPFPATPPAVQLLALAGNDVGRNFVLSLPRIRIGRSVDNDVVLTDISVSRRHVVLEAEGGVFYVRDVGSGNGTLINGKKHDGRTPLHSGDRLEMGNTVLGFSIADADGNFGDEEFDDAATLNPTEAPAAVIARNEPVQFAPPPPHRPAATTMPPLRAPSTESKTTLPLRRPPSQPGNGVPLRPPAERYPAFLDAPPQFSGQGAPPSQQRPSAGPESSRAPLPGMPPSESPQQAPQAPAPPLQAPYAEGPQGFAPTAHPPTMTEPGAFISGHSAPLAALAQRQASRARHSERRKLLVAISVLCLILLASGVTALVLGSRNKKLANLRRQAPPAANVDEPSSANPVEAVDEPAANQPTDDAPTNEAEPEPAAAVAATDRDEDAKPDNEAAMAAQEPNLGEPSAPVENSDTRRVEQERLERERAEQERKEQAQRERAEQERREQERAEQERKEQERAEQERKEQAQRERAEQERQERERAAASQSAADNEAKLARTKRQALELYKNQNFAAATSLLRDTADSVLDDDSAEELLDLAVGYGRVGKLFAAAEDSKRTDAPRSLRAYKSALQVDKKVSGGAHQTLIRLRIGQVAPLAARAYMAKSRYGDARDAAADAAKYGDAADVAAVLSSLERRAQSQLSKARKAADAGDAREAKSILQAVLGFAPTTGESYAQARSELKKL